MRSNTTTTIHEGMAGSFLACWRSAVDPRRSVQDRQVLVASSHGRLPHAEASDLLLRPPLEAGTVQDNAFASKSLQHSEPPSYRFLHRRGAAAFPAAQSGRKPRAISNCKCCCHCVYCCWSVMLRDPEMNLRGHGTIISAVPDNMWSHIAYEWLH
jgi:hypothetical protein